jgi:hypothetical protein
VGAAGGGGECGGSRGVAGSREEEETDVGLPWSQGRRNRGGHVIPYCATGRAMGVHLNEYVMPHFLLRQSFT